MCYVVITKFFRRRLVLAIIFLLSFSYCMVHLIQRNNSFNLNADYLQTQQLLRSKNIIWNKARHIRPGAKLAEVLVGSASTIANETDEDRGGEQPAPSNSCRNSIQGKSLLVDDRGYVCARTELLANGCCSENADTVKLFSCYTCRPNRCCAVYEYCVACCLNPDKRPILEEVLAKANGRQVALYAEVTDQFELCMTKCRTNSQSVQNENKYRNPEQKHCYGEIGDAGAAAAVTWISESGKDAQKMLPDDT
uniref:SREBP regulating gene protein n=1 Tax=Anopheles epiroticus TaxID=199890 RepID=A0A182PUB9_9DIPT